MSKKEKKEKKPGMWKKVLIVLLIFGVIGLIFGGDSEPSSDDLSEQATEQGAESKESADKSLLESVMKTAAGNNQSIYTEESWSALMAAIDSAQAVVDDDEATQEEVDAAREGVTDAVSALKKILVPDNYAALSYEGVARTPDDYMGESVVFSGKVLQVMEDSSITSLRVATSNGWDDVMLVQYESDLLDFRVLEDDNVTAYGVYTGLVTYESTLGADITIPSMFAEFVVLG